jgi:hypothetical protein
MIIGSIPSSVQTEGDPDPMVSAMIQMPKAAIPTEIKNDSALSICIPQHLLPYHRLGRATGIRQKDKPFRVVSFRFMFFGQVDDHDCTVHAGTLAGVNIPSASVFPITQHAPVTLR